MKSVQCENFGPPETLKLKDLPNLIPTQGQVRIATEACGVNFPDTLIIENKYQFKPDLPFAPGGEVTGIVDAVGDGVSQNLLGQPVMCMTLSGGFAEQTICKAEDLIARPSFMPSTVAAGFTMTYGTSMHALKQRAQLQARETLLVLGAGGGVGLAAVEIGKQMNATVIAAASSTEKLNAAKDAGADHLIDYSQQDLRSALKDIVGKKGVDVVYDPVGGDMFEAALRSTAWGGRVLVVGFASGDIPKIPVNLALLKGCSIVGVFWGAFRLNYTKEDNENFEQLFAWYDQGKLKPFTSKTYTLNETALALNDLKNRKAIGKLIIQISS
ncbi:NADPH:quinone oxidoreductase family protein [Rhodobacteraceae bacterium]|nr:NADPH:quinone oxidoreductase family protein [Paracoccaceae bacterium]